MDGVPPTCQRDGPPRLRRGEGLALAELLAVAAIFVLIAGGGVWAWTMMWRPAPASVAGAPAIGAPGSVSGASAPAGPTSGAASPAPSPSAPATPSPAATQPLPPLPDFVAHPQAVPILVYHHLLAKPKGPPLVTMSIRLFKAQLAWLAAHGYQAVTLQRVYDAWVGDGILPPKAVVITFDDGYVDQIDAAPALLRERHWPAELDLVWDALDLGSDPPADRVTPEMVRELLEQGWGLESHSVTHADLTRLHGRRLRHELRTSKRLLEQAFDVPVNFFCYPGGIYTKRIKLAARAAGYLAATGTRFGAALPRDLFSLPRIYCYGGESMSAFGERLSAVLAAAKD